MSVWERGKGILPALQSQPSLQKLVCRRLDAHCREDLNWHSPLAHGQRLDWLVW